MEAKVIQIIISSLQMIKKSYSNLIYSKGNHT